MTAKTITIAQQKGGAGKSTLAAHLAVCILMTGKKVALVDIDPQSSLTFWHTLRVDTAKKATPGLVFENVTGWRVPKQVEALGKSVDYIVIDSPPHAETDARLAVRAADLVIIPTQPSPLDVWASEPTLTLAAREKSKALMVLNRVPPRALLTDQMMEILSDYDAKIAKATLGNRVAFPEAMALGLCAPEHKSSTTAAHEIKALTAEILKALP